MGSKITVEEVARAPAANEIFDLRAGGKRLRTQQSMKTHPIRHLYRRIGWAEGRLAGNLKGS